MTNTTFDRMLELVAHAHRTGIELPAHPRRIVELEDAGYLVDLETGAVVRDDDNTVAPWPTAAALVMAREVRTEPVRITPLWERVRCEAHLDDGAQHRAIALAGALHNAGRWDGRDGVVVRDPYGAHLRCAMDGIDAVQLGVDYYLTDAEDFDHDVILD